MLEAAAYAGPGFVLSSYDNRMKAVVTSERRSARGRGVRRARPGSERLEPEAPRGRLQHTSPGLTQPNKPELALSGSRLALAARRCPPLRQHQHTHPESYKITTATEPKLALSGSPLAPEWSRSPLLRRKTSPQCKPSCSDGRSLVV